MSVQQVSFADTPGNALAVTGYSPSGDIIPPQVHTDAGLIDMWVNRYESEMTKREYRGDIRRFAAFSPKPLRSVTLPDIQAYAASMAHLAPNTVARRLSAIKSLIKLGRQTGYLTFDPGVMVKLPKIKDTLAQRIITEEQTLKMLGTVRRPRDAALLRLIYGAGLRVSEACGLRWADMVPRDDGEGQITVFGKGGDTRDVLLPAHLWQRVNGLRRDALPEEAVFRSRQQGRAIHPRQVLRIVKLAARRSGLPVSISTHWLRHAHVSHSLSRGAPVHVVRATVGHASLETTTKYAHARPGDSSARYLTA
jgi:site-specific recombinase XerD